MRKKITLFSLIILLHILFFNGCGEGPKTAKVQNNTSEETGNGNDGIFTEPELDSLTVSHGKLTPDFDPGITGYSIIIRAEVSALLITAVPSAGSTFEISSSEPSEITGSYTVSITEPETGLSISVNNEAGEGIIYYLKIRRMEEVKIPNSSFELSDEQKHPQQWKVSGAGELISADSEALSGNFSGSFTTLTASIGGREALSAPVMISSGKGILISGWFYIEDLPERSPGRILFSYKVYYYTDAECSTPASVKASTMAKTALASPGVWENITYERGAEQIPPDGSFTRIGVRICYDMETGGTKHDRAFFDDIGMQQ